MVKLPPLSKIFQKRLEETENSRLSFSLSAPLAVALGLILACAIGWAYFMGFMVGKGQNPQARINDMTGGFLQRESKQPDQAEESMPEAAAARETARTEGMPRGEIPTPDNPAQQDLAFARPEAKELGAWGAHPENAAPAQSEKLNASPLFDFSWQVAAYKNARDAKNLRQKLQAVGVKSQERKSGKVTLVLVNMRGSEEDAADLRRKLADLKLGEPLRLAKKPVASKSRPAQTAAAQKAAAKTPASKSAFSKKAKQPGVQGQKTSGSGASAPKQGVRKTAATKQTQKKSPASKKSAKKTDTNR